LFFALQLAAVLAYAPDNIIVAQTLGAAWVTQYAVAAKLFSVSLLLSDVTLAPLWPAYGEAIARGDGDWVRRTFGQSIRIAMIGSVAVASTLVLTGGMILRIWVGSEVTASLGLLLALGMWTVLAALGMAAAMYLNAANLMRIQVLCATFTVPASIALKIVFARRWGVAAVPWAMVIAYATLTLLPLALLRRHAGLHARRSVAANA
jgi:O-antigen/teichoic acid export membrane protein